MSILATPNWLDSDHFMSYTALPDSKVNIVSLGTGDVCSDQVADTPDTNSCRYFVFTHLSGAWSWPLAAGSSDGFDMQTLLAARRLVELPAICRSPWSG